MNKELSEGELQSRLDAAAKQVAVGGTYRHYRGGLYKVLGVAILESNNDICVIYQAQYGKKLTFLRPVSEWCEDIEFQRQTVKRFSQIE